ncbi:MAG: hypothetical protein MUO52_13170 [Desulfobacterales bacterium]|nr:hypothetical protein [Desulfobacterales bacterium]
MRKRIKIFGVLMMIVMVSSFAAAVQSPVLQQAGTSAQLDLSGQDVITASDAGGGYLSSRDLLIIATIGIVILVVVLVL